MKKTLGGERLGGGKKNQVEMHGYSRSTHDLSKVVRTTMSVGTLVPFYKVLALPGDTMDIDIDVDVMTNPTIGPLFGSMKIHVDFFGAPVRLYQGQLHQNRLGIGLNMSSILLPQLLLDANAVDLNRPVDNQHVNPSSLLKYLGISGTGFKTTVPNDRRFNAVAYLAYWEIYKQYYSNKQEANGACVHINPQPITPTITLCTMNNANANGSVNIPINPAAVGGALFTFNETSNMVITFSAGQLTTALQLNQIVFETGTTTPTVSANQIFRDWEFDIVNNRMIGTNAVSPVLNLTRVRINGLILADTTPKVYRFPLANIDTMKNNILSWPMIPANAGLPYVIDVNSVQNPDPYNLPFRFFQTAAGPPVVRNYSTMFSQEALALRTYASDLFNNWLDTATIDGGTGIKEVTKVNVVGNKFTIDELNLSKKVYDMLNRIAISGGTYDDWLDAVYTHERTRGIESPIYLGGALRNLVFQEVISTAATADEALGTLAGRGRMGGLNKGGKITVKVDEPMYIMGIVSIVPNLDYSQGNDWDMGLKTMNDFHKPALDEIGFQNLITDQMAWWDTLNVSATSQTFRSAGKQPAWINYMTDYNQVYGNFADESQQMFMVLARRYNWSINGGHTRIDDLTTYIDPSKFNHIFADVRLDAMNYWVQIGVKNTARRKMSAKVIPNL